MISFLNVPLSLMVGMFLASLVGTIGGAVYEHAPPTDGKAGIGFVIGYVAPIAYGMVWAVVAGYVCYIRNRKQGKPA